VHIKKHLSFAALRAALSEIFEQIEDSRQAGKVDYRLHDCLMSALAMMVFQDPSLLSFQRRMHDPLQCGNLKALFAVEAIPKDTALRESVDAVSTEALTPAFEIFLQRLQRGKQLAAYRFLDGHYLIALDGSQYFSSEQIQCPGCLTHQGAKGPLRYSHQILQAVMLHPHMRQVLPLAPEPVANTDGHRKQDCELAAAKRILPKIRTAHPRLPIIITADGLYSDQPFVDALKKAGMSFILVAKPTDHKLLFEWVNELSGLGDGARLEFTDAKGRRHTYRWLNQVPLNGSRNTDELNFFEYWLTVGQKVTYHNSWVSDITVSENNVRELVQGGRARWKIENETFNTLKNQGYHIEHNFGHGQKQLSMNFFVLNVLAFYIHQILELCDLNYQYCRSKFSSRQEYWNNLRVAIRMLFFNDFDHLLRFVAQPPEIRAP
jgi:Transposase DDE domain